MEAWIDLGDARRKVETLLFPRNIVLVGATDRAGSWAARTWASLAKYGYPKPVYPVNPGRQEVFGARCFPDFQSLPEPPDHLVLVVPAKAVADALRSASSAGARSATILSSGFEEAGGTEGPRLAGELREVIVQTGLAVSGPNCLGNICAKSRLATLSQDGELTMRPGAVALVGQSGGVAIFINRVLQDRGIDAGYIISTGNETGLCMADYIAYFATEPDTKVVLCYAEGIHKLNAFRDACRLARANGKWIVVLKSGQSAAGKQAALAHTGSLAGSIEMFDALAADLGVIRVDSFDDAIEITELLVHSQVPAGRRLAGLSLSGAFCAMLHDAAARNGLAFPSLLPSTTERLRSLLFVGASIGNPLDGGYGVLTSEDTYCASVEALAGDPNVDALVIQEEVPREPGTDRRGERYLRRVDRFAAGNASKPIVYTTILSHGQSEYSRALRRELPHLAFLQEPNKTLRALDRAIRCTELERLAQAGPQPRSSPPEFLRSVRHDVARLRGDRGASAVPLSEVESRTLLARFGIPGPLERLVNRPAEAVEAAEEIGYPVVLKAVSRQLAHKSEFGAVQLGLASAQDVRSAWDRIGRNLDAAGFQGRLDGMLVAAQAGGGLEAVLGVHRDPEIGMAVMCGTGGTQIELVKDVAFAVPPINEAKARHMIGRTRLSILLRGFRGAASCDEAALVEALVNLGRLACELEDALEAVDVNPFLVRPVGQGAVALDALVVLRPVSGPARN